MALRNAHRALERHEARTAPTGRRDPASAGATIVAEVPRRTWLKARGAVRGAVAIEPPESNKAREVRRREQIARRACDYSARSIGALFQAQLARAREKHAARHTLMKGGNMQCDRGSARGHLRTPSARPKPPRASLTCTPWCWPMTGAGFPTAPVEAPSVGGRRSSEARNNRLAGMQRKSNGNRFFAPPAQGWRRVM
jgi:hypothetical protein